MATAGALVALFAAASCQVVSANSDGRSFQEAEALADETSLLQRGLSLESGQPTVPLLQQDSQRTDSSSRRGHHIPSLSINLDLPPEERWPAALGALGDLLKLIGNVAWPVDRTFIDDVDWTPDEELLAEMRGIVKAVGSPSFTLEHMLAFEVTYERGFTACTGVVAATPDGTVFHGRNLDLAPNLREGLESVTMDVTYFRGGKPLFAATTMGMGIGLHTGYRIGSYSVAQNTRPGCGDIEHNREGARRGGRPFPLLMRRVLQEVDNYEDAVHRLAETPLIAPQYFTVAGAGAWEGALVTRDRHGHSAPYPNVETLSPQINRWFIVQTNDDTWKPASDDRRPTALAKLSNMASSSLNAKTMLEVMMTAPVLNNGTVFTWILQPSTGLRRVFLGSDELRGDVVPALVSDIKPPHAPLLKKRARNSRRR